MKTKRAWSVGDTATLLSADGEKSATLVVKTVNEIAKTLEFTEKLPEWCNVGCKLSWEKDRPRITIGRFSWSPERYYGEDWPIPKL